MIKEEKILKNSLYKSDIRPIIKQNQSFFDMDNNINVKKDEIQISGVIVEPAKNIDEKINLKDWYFYKYNNTVRYRNIDKRAKPKVTISIVLKEIIFKDTLKY